MEYKAKELTPNEWVLVSEDKYEEMLPAYRKSLSRFTFWSWAIPVGTIAALLSLPPMGWTSVMLGGVAGSLHIYLNTIARRKRVQVEVMDEIVKSLKQQRG